MSLTRFRKAFAWRYRRFVRRQGFAVMTILCAAVIAGSAAWTRKAGFQRIVPSPTAEVQSAADLWQQSLQNAVTDPPAEAKAPVWQSPLTELSLLQGFDAERLVPSGIPGLWRVHDAVDLAASPGEAVAAMRDGTVINVTEDVYGATVVIDHGDGCVAEYAGLSETNHQPGQQIRAGEIIGSVGEAHGQGVPCLHLRLTRDTMPVDLLPFLSPSQP